jgi:hypothetical protein
VPLTWALARKAELKGIGGLSSATAGALLRKIGELEDQGAEALFGEPELAVADLLRTTPEGQGVVSLLELSAVGDKPKLFSTFLLWLLAELFEELPEVGDLDQPKLVFFFDEAHLLFDDASEAFLDQVAQTVRLIRSKGVGVYFVTQLPDDVPEEVLGQPGNRIQHALRAFTPRDAKALKAAVTTYPKTADYDLEEDLTQLGTGEVMVTILSERGAPTPVVWTRLCPPRSLMAAIEAEGMTKAAEADPLWGKYGTEIDRESAQEKLAARLAGATEAAPQSVEDLEVPPARPPSPRPPSAGGARSRAATPSSTTSRLAKAAPWSTPSPGVSSASSASAGRSGSPCLDERDRWVVAELNPLHPLAAGVA